MKVTKWIKRITPAVVISTAVCAPPTYHTADVQPGTSVSIGGGYVDCGYYNFLDTPRFDPEQIQALSFDMAFRYSGWDRLIQKGYPERTWKNVAFVGKAGISASRDRGEFHPPQVFWDSTLYVFPRAELAVQYQYCQKPALAIQTGLSFPFLTSVTFLAGIPAWGREIATVGFKTEWLYVPAALFVTVHPLRQLHLYVQTNPRAFFTNEWELQAGLGIDVVNIRNKGGK